MKIDLTYHIEISNPPTTRTIVTFRILLDKKIILETLRCESILIETKYYKVPEAKMLECLMNASYGLTDIDLELIK